MKPAARRHLPVPLVAWAYGGLGLVPFVAGAATTLIVDDAHRAPVQLGLLVYGGLILSFLGGGRWGMEVSRGPVRTGVISGSMGGAVLSTILVAATGLAPGWRLLGLALGHLGQWAWDVRSEQTPTWYPILRHILTAVAVLSLLVGAGASLRAQT